MDSQLSSVIDRVKKLLALSKSANANEAANAAGLANKLIDQYRLSSVDIESDQSGSDPMIEDDSYIYETGRIIPWKRNLILVLANHYSVAHYNDNYFPAGRQVSRFKLIGRSSDIQIVRYMFTWLSNECQRLSGSVKGRGRVIVASYCDGFVNGIYTQLKASRQEVEKTVTTAAIIKLDNRLQEATNFMYSSHATLEVVKTRSVYRRNTEAFIAGQQQGQNIHLGSVMGESKTNLLS